MICIKRFARPQHFMDNRGGGGGGRRGGRIKQWAHGGWIPGMMTAPAVTAAVSHANAAAEVEAVAALWPWATGQWCHNSLLLLPEPAAAWQPLQCRHVLPSPTEPPSSASSSQGHHRHSRTTSCHRTSNMQRHAALCSIMQQSGKNISVVTTSPRWQLCNGCFDDHPSLADVHIVQTHPRKYAVCMTWHKQSRHGQPKTIKGSTAHTRPLLTPEKRSI